MAVTVTVTIYYKNGTSKVLRVAEDRAIHYENLPFSDTDVDRVEVKY